jgi:predicted RND superfamily exporter protein
MLALVPLLFGIVITAGMIFILFGTLNMMAAIFAVLLLGLGIDFSIHMLARFTEEMKVHKDVQKAFDKTSMHTGKAIVLGTFTTATAFGALAFSKTQGLYEMGVILALGLIITMICVFFTLPALVTLRLKFGKLGNKLQKPSKFNPLGGVGRAAAKFAVVFVIILIVFGAFFAIKAPDAKMNEDLNELQPKTIPAYELNEKLKEEFEYSEDNLLCVVDSFEALESNVSGFRAIDEVMKVESILDYLPNDQESKLGIIEQSKTTHPEFSNISWLSQDEMTWRDLPDSIKENWVHEDSEGVKFLIRIQARGNIWDDEYRAELVKDLSKVNPDIVATAISWPIMIEMMTEDVVWVTIFAIIPIFIIVYIGFRKKSLVYTVLALVPVGFGVFGILALSGYLGINLNMISIMMIPLVVGIGIDDGIHILHRYKEEGPGSIPKVVQNTGKAIFLTTMTTCLAFSSFTIAAHPGLRSLGQVPLLGLILALVAAIFFVPALIKLILDRRSASEMSKVQVSQNVIHAQEGVNNSP